MTRVAAFDLDGTITDRDCVVPFMRELAGTARLLAAVATHPVRLGSAVLQRDRDALKAAAARAAFSGRALVDVEGAAAHFADRVHREWVRTDAIERIEQHRAEGDSIVIVSASWSVYVEPLAVRLGIEHVLATRLQVDSSGHLTGRLDGSNCRGVEKVRRLHLWLDQHHGGRDRVEVVAYGDSPGDRELLADADTAHWVGAR